jgi:hypothetical protein
MYTIAIVNDCNELRSAFAMHFEQQTQRLESTQKQKAASKSGPLPSIGDASPRERVTGAGNLASIP